MAESSTSNPHISSAADFTTHQLVHDTIVRWLRDEASLPVDQIDYDAPLFDLGIDSLGAANIGCQLEEHTGKTLHPEVLYELETINELAEHLDSLSVSKRHESEISLPATSVVVESDCSVLPSPSANGGLLHRYERLNRRVKRLKQEGRYFFEPEISVHDGAWVVADGKRMLMLGSYEYLGLLGHPHLKQAAIDTIQTFGTGHHGVRLLAGTTTVHRQLESRLARFMRAEDAIVYSSGYVTNLTTISTLVGPGDVVIGDQWNHASIMDGCRMSGRNSGSFGTMTWTRWPNSWPKLVTDEPWSWWMPSSVWTAISSTFPVLLTCARNTVRC